MHGYTDRKDEYNKRLRRIEGRCGAAADGRRGQILHRHLTQISAATKALQSVALGLFGGARRALRGGRFGGRRPEADAKVKEANEAIARLVRS